MPKLIPTTLVGSYRQPAWLVDYAVLEGRTPPRTRITQVWRPDPELLSEAQDDATRLAVQYQEQAGLDVITDGEMRRESYSNRFATALEGIDHDHPGEHIDRTGVGAPVPRVVGPIRRPGPVEAEDVRFLRSLTDRPIKITVPGPFTLSEQAEDEHYRDQRALALAYADAVNQEVRDLFAAGADIVQLDEPYAQARAERARGYAVEAVNRALEGVSGRTALHMCFGYGHFVHEKPDGYAFWDEWNDSLVDELVIEAAQPGLDLARLARIRDKTVAVGVINCGNHEAETAEKVADRLRAALQHLPAERLVATTDCGLKYTPRDVARAKLQALADGAAIVRAELGGNGA
jgi:5-methyltetrahydropteroyltriglutamate--homocysteine methyltransferase